MERTGFEQWKPREVARLLALVETERRYYQEMVAALPIALAVLSTDRSIVSSNRAFRKLVNLSGEELRQRRIEQVLPSEELIERIRSAHVHADTQPFLIGMGERRFRMAAVPIRSWEDEAQAETLLMVDPLVAEAAVAEAPPAPPAAAPTPDLSGLPAVIWHADPTTFAFTYVGGSAEDLLGFPAAHWLAEPLFFSERIHPDDRDQVMAQYRAAIASGGASSAEYRAIDASGAAVWVRETIRVPGPYAAPVAGVAVAIGERRQLEAQAVAAERINALRGLASRLAHDLNNPLMIVTGYSEELMGALPAGDVLRADLKEMIAAANRMAELAASLLAFTRQQAKPASLLSLGEVVTGLDARLRAMASDVEFAFPDGAIWTLADRDQLEEAIAALAAFAVENTSEVSKLTVTCHTSEITERIQASTLTPGIYARLDVHAAGHGSRSAVGAFESILPSKDPHKAAAGAVSRAYLNVRQWGGDIAFESNAAHGSSFTVYLPYAEAPYAEPAFTEPPAAETPAPPVEPKPPEPEPLFGAILIVEDEPGIRGLVRKILRRERYDVLEAGSGEEALQAAAAHGHGIDLLLTDVMLPGIGGRELAESLSATQPDLKVVYISGFTDDERVRAGDFPPGSRFLQKPFTLSALVGAVKEALGR